jgi:uncharacterized protein
MQPYLTTTSGQRYRLTGPELDTPRIGDIAHHLAQINRFTGAASRPYSVAEHSLLCEQIAASEGAPPIGRLCALMHDGHEAYTADFASPAKLAVRAIAAKDARYGSDFDYFESLHAEHIRKSFDLSDAFRSMVGLDVKRWDLIALATERAALMPQDDGDGWAILNGIGPWDGYDLRGKLIYPWDHWRDMFLDKFSFLTCLINSTK